MPFDDNGFQEQRSPDLIMMDKVIGQLSSEKCWCKGALYTIDGKHCILGAMQAVKGATILKPTILQAIKEVDGHRYAAVETFNDRKSTTFPKVREVLLKARQIIVENEGNALHYQQFRSKPASRLAKIFS